MNRQEAAEVLAALKQSLEMSDDYDYCYYSRDIDAYDTALTALREPSCNWNVKECADLIAAMSEGETLTIWKKNGFLRAVRGKTIDAWKPLTVRKN